MSDPSVTPWNQGRLRIPEAQASPASQVAVFGVAASAFVLLGWLSQNYPAAVAAVTALGIGAVVGATTSVDRFFRNAPGLLMGVLAIPVVSLAGVIVLSLVDAPPPPAGDQLVLGLGLLIWGLDWRRVTRLRLVPVATGVPMSAVAVASGPALAMTLAWLALALVSLWSLEIDQRRSYEHPRSLASSGAKRPGSDATDLVASLALTLALGLVIASFAVLPSCNLSLGDLRLPWRPSSTRVGSDHANLDLGRWLMFDLDGQISGLRLPQGGEVLPNFELDGDWWRLVAGADGRPQLENLRTGERLDLSLEGGDIVARDSDGRERARFPGVGGSEGSASNNQDLKDHQTTQWWKTALVAALAMVLLGLAAWWWTRRRRPSAADPRSWAEQQVRVLERFAADHDRPRAVDRSPRAMLADLASTVSPDPRLVRVADVLTDALFGRAEPTMEERLRTEQAIAEVIEAHPPPEQRGRRRRTSPPTLTEAADRRPS